MECITGESIYETGSLLHPIQAIRDVPKTGQLIWLVVMRRLVELQGGSVEVESIFGEGSRFSLILPWQPEED